MTEPHTAEATGRSPTDPLAVAVQPLKVTAARLTEVEARHKAATPGTWERDSRGGRQDDPFHHVVTSDDGKVLLDTMNNEVAGPIWEDPRDPDDFGGYHEPVGRANLEFVAHAHQDVPDLAADHRSLTALAEIAGQTVDVLQEWFGSASTQRAAVDSLWRLTRALQRAGFNAGPRRDNLLWRGSLLDELWQAGFFKGADGLMHLDQQQREHGDAVGPTLKEVAAGFLAARAVSPEAATLHADTIEAIANELDLDRSDPEAVLEAVRDLKRRVERFEKIVIVPQCGEHLSHAEVAGRVRMLMRHDLDHEAVCVTARDRIMWLANRVGELEAERDRFKVRFYAAADVQAVMGDDVPVPGPNGNSIPWIKRLRERCGCTLREAKHAHDLLVSRPHDGDPVEGLSADLRRCAGGQTDGFGRVHSRAADALDAQAAELARIKAMLADPMAVFVNLKRGGIAVPSLRALLDLHPGALERWDRAVDLVAAIEVGSVHPVAPDPRQVVEQVGQVVGVLDAEGGHHAVSDRGDVAGRGVDDHPAVPGRIGGNVVDGKHMPRMDPGGDPRQCKEEVRRNASEQVQTRCFLSPETMPKEPLTTSSDENPTTPRQLLDAGLTEPMQVGPWVIGWYEGADGDDVQLVRWNATLCTWETRVDAIAVTFRGWLPFRLAAPLPLVLHCPRCGLQHIDAPDETTGWTNPPHRSHLCAGCGTTWRPADFPTTGVEAVETKGKADTWPQSPTVEEILVEGVLPLMALGRIPPWAVGKISMPDPDRPGFRIVGFRVPVKPVADAGAAMRGALDQLATFRDGDAEARMVANADHLNCPACGGSGHVCDARPAGMAEAAGTDQAECGDAG